MKRVMKFLVNFLTVFRCLFTFAMPALIKSIPHFPFILIIGALFFTDWIDGFLSRRCKVQTLFGSIMDTIADKVLCIILILCIAYEMPILYMIMIGEILIATINLGGTFGGAHIVSNMVGKSKMWVLAAVTLLGYMAYFNLINEIFVTVVGILALTMQIIVIFMYSKNTKSAGAEKKKRYMLKPYKELKNVLFDTDYYLSTMSMPLIDKITIEDNTL